MPDASQLAGPFAALGFGGLLGAAAGYTAKKTIKFAAILVGIAFALFQVAAWYGLVQIDWTAVERSAGAVWRDGQGTTLASRAWDVLSANLPFGGAFVAGFALGFKLG